MIYTPLKLRIQLSPFLKDILFTTLTSALVTISMVLSTRFLANGLGPESFGTYSLARRFISLALPFTTLSIGTALTRYLAVAGTEKDKNAYFADSLIIILSCALLFFACGWLGHDKWSLIIFHGTQYKNLFYASLFMIICFGFFTILYSYYRGLLRMDRANILQMIIMGLVPLFISYFFAANSSAAELIFYMGIASCLCFLPLFFHLKNLPWRKVPLLKNHTAQLLKYGIPRTPGGIALAGILFIGPYLANAYGNTREAGFLVIGQSVFRVLEASIVAFGFVALPKVSQLFAENRTEFLRNRIGDIITMIIQIGLFTVVELFIWSDEIVRLWLGTEYLQAVPYIQIFLVSLCPYLGYVMLRSIVDAVEEKAVNTVNLLIGLLITILFSLWLASTPLKMYGLALGCGAGFYYLGISTAFYLIKKYHVSIHVLPLLIAGAVNVIFALLTLMIKNFLADPNDPVRIIGIICSTITVLSAIYIMVLYKTKAQWLLELKKRVTRA